MNKLLFGSPIRQDTEILKEFLIGLDELDLEGIDVSYFFIDDNSDEKSSVLLTEFAKTHSSAIIKKPSDYSMDFGEEYLCGNSTHQWKTELIQRITVYKNDIIRYARENGFDYLYFIDSDIIMHPNTVKHLISRNVDIVSNIFWTQWTIPGDLYPQVWLQDESQYFTRDWDNSYNEREIEQKRLDFFAQLKLPGIYKVGGLGACTLLNRKSIESGVNFSLIDNVSFWGEDRHFCVRARVLGLGLYVDTVYPAYHIYRKFYLSGVENYKKNGFDFKNRYVSAPEGVVMNKQEGLITRIKNRLIKLSKTVFHKMEKISYRKKRVINQHHKITLSMIVKNEENRYLEEVLKSAAKYVDEAVIIDDASTDNTVLMCERLLKDIPHKIIVNEKSMFAQEGKLRKQQWDETVKMNPDWILFLDADEILENRFCDVKDILINNNDIDLFCFKLYDMWDNEHYRNDVYWNAHTRYMPFMLRYQPKFKYQFNMNNHHCGRMPMNSLKTDYANVDVRVKHYGWSREEDRKAKYERYMQLDPGGKFGILEQYESIMDKSPNLVRFEDEN